MAFKTIHTLYGLTKLSQAEAASTPINLPEMAVGDGLGNAVEPYETQTTLVRELYRAAVNRVYQDPVDPTKFSAELIIPASVGGFVLREVGLFDASGSLFVVGNLPETYKPTSTDGAFSDTVVRVDFKVANADTITIIADPNVVLVTQQWISNNVTAGSIIPGGTTGQVLSKASNADGDTVWADPDVANVVVDVIEERQTLAASQTDVILAVVTTRGLAVYIDGVRIPKGAAADEWEEDATDPDTTLVLGTSYPAGTEILCVQNEPSGAVPFPLIRDQNLADVPDKALGRTNLGVYDKAETDQKAPPSEVSYFARATAPTGWLKANGAAISRTAYAALFAAIGTSFGAGDGFTTFNLPDLRGEFLRGWDDGRGVDGGRTLGSAQTGELQSHAHSGSSADSGAHLHTGTAQTGGAHNHSATSVAAGAHDHQLNTNGVAGGTVGVIQGGLHAGSGKISSGTTTAADHVHSVSVGSGGDHAHALSINSGGAHNHAITVAASGGGETRPRNVALLACIKY